VGFESLLLNRYSIALVLSRTCTGRPVDTFMSLGRSCSGELAGGLVDEVEHGSKVLVVIVDFCGIRNALG
jgi:hypothetical protein